MGPGRPAGERGRVRAPPSRRAPSARAWPAHGRRRDEHESNCSPAARGDRPGDASARDRRRAPTAARDGPRPERDASRPERGRRRDRPPVCPARSIDPTPACTTRASTLSMRLDDPDGSTRIVVVGPASRRPGRVSAPGRVPSPRTAHRARVEEDGPMTEERWRTVAIVLGVVLALLVVLVFVTSLPIGSPSPTPSATGGRPSGSAAGSPSESAATRPRPRASLPIGERGDAEPDARRPGQCRARHDLVHRVQARRRRRYRREGPDLHVQDRRSGDRQGQADGQEPAGHDQVLPEGRNPPRPSAASGPPAS